jgi:uncharacterized protein (DUF885 family)
MKKKLALPIILGAFILIGFGVLHSHQNSEDAKFAKLVDNYLDEYWKMFPSAGSMAGFAKYDAKLEDFSEGNIEKHLAATDKISAEVVNKIAKDKLSPAIQLDLDVFRNLIDLGQYRLEKIAPQQLNPIFYNDVILNSLRSLLTGSAPLDARLKSASDRMKALPGLLKQAKENLTTPPKEYTDEAIRQFAGILDYYKTEAPKSMESAAAEVKTKFQTEWTKAVAALEEYQKFLQGDLLAKSTGSFRMGEAHQRLLQLTTLGNIPLNDMQAQAQADYKNIRREMLKISAQFYKIMDPKFNVETVQNVTEDQLTNNVVPHVLDRIKTEQPTKTEVADRINAAVAEIKAFIDQTKIIDLPADPFVLEMAPPLQRNQRLVSLLTPSPYAQGGDFKVLLNPIAETLEGDQAKGFLDEYNNYFLKMWTLVNVYPGSFVPTVSTRKNSSLLQKFIPNEGLNRGWSVYAADMFIPAGFGNYDLKLLLNHMKLQLRPSIDFIVEVQVHEGNLTKEQALRLMTATGFRTAGEAERTWNTIVLHPFQTMYAYLGYQEILGIEADYKKAKGDAFSKKEFLQKILSFGSLPFRELKTKVLS